MLSLPVNPISPSPIATTECQCVFSRLRRTTAKLHLYFRWSGIFLLVVTAVVSLPGLVLLTVYTDTDKTRGSQWGILRMCLGKSLSSFVDWDAARQLICVFADAPDERHQPVHLLSTLYLTPSSSVNLTLMCQLLLETGRHALWVVYVSCASVLAAFVAQFFAGVLYFGSFEQVERKDVLFTLYVIGSFLFYIAHLGSLTFWFVRFDRFSASGLTTHFGEGFYLLVLGLVCHGCANVTLLFELLVIKYCPSSDARCVEIDLLLTKAKQQGMMLKRPLVNDKFLQSSSRLPYRYTTNQFSGADASSWPCNTPYPPSPQPESTYLGYPPPQAPTSPCYYPYLPRPIDVLNSAQTCL